MIGLTDNTSKSRTIPCIALHPCANATYSWDSMNTTTRQRVRRSHWIPLVATQLITDDMNNYFETLTKLIVKCLLGKNKYFGID